MTEYLDQLVLSRDLSTRQIRVVATSALLPALIAILAVNPNSFVISTVLSACFQQT